MVLPQLHSVVVPTARNFFITGTEHSFLAEQTGYSEVFSVHEVSGICSLAAGVSLEASADSGGLQF